MKLHLPVMLRRSLLALIALLSPAVVTTTLATATLATIFAPAMADDLTLNANSNAFATNLTVDELHLASGVTSATLEPDRSTITTLTVTADSINLTADQKLYLSNVKIQANKGINTLLSNVAGTERISLTTSSIWGAGGSSSSNALQSSLLNEKLFPNGQSYVYITEGHIVFNEDIRRVLNCNLGDGNQSANSGTVAATTSSSLNSLRITYFESDATLNLDSGTNDFTLNVYSIKGNVKTKRNLTLTANSSWAEYASMYGTSSISTEENSTASITLDKVKLFGGKVTADTIILKDILAYDYYEATLTAANKLLVQGDISLLKSKAIAGQTIIDAGKSFTLGAGAFTTGAVTIGTGATLTLGSTTNLKGIITNNGTLMLGGTITVDSTAFTAGSRERYSAGDNGYKTIDTTYTVLTGAAATGSATWKVGTTRATYEDGLVIVAGIEDKSVYYVRNGDVNYTQSLAQATTIFSLEGGHLQLGESLADGLSLVAKAADSSVDVQDRATLKSSQISVEGAGSVKLSGSGVYEITSAELGLGSGVSLSGTDWNGTVKTTGATTVSSDVDTTDWKNTELNGATTVNSGASLTLGGNATLGGKITNSGTLNLGGSIDVRSSMSHTSASTYAATGDDSDLGTESGSGFATTLDVYTVVDGNAATDTATWTVGGQAAHYDSGKVSLLTNKDTTTWWMNSSAAYSTISGNFVTGSTMSLALNTENGTLQLDTAPGVKLVSKKTTTVEIVDTVTLNASQLDASAAEVTLSGGGSYTMTNGANTLGTGVSVGSDWSGTVNTTGDTSELELDKLGVSGSKVALGSNDHTLADSEQEVAANLNSTGSISLTGNKLTLSGTNNALGSLTVGSLEIAGGSTTVDNGLTTVGESSVAIGASLSIKGASSIGGKIENSGTLNLGGTITVNKDAFTPDSVVKEVMGYFIGSSKTPNSTNSGFEAACWDITIAVGGTIIDNGVTWKLVGDENATFDFEDDGTLHAYGSNVGTVFHVAEGDTITYDEAHAAHAAVFVNSKGEAVTAIQLNGGTLELQSALGSTVKSTAASSVVIAEGGSLNASQLDASAARVTLSGEGIYDMQGQELDGTVQLATGVALDENAWKGTVYTGSTKKDAELKINALGNRQSTVYLGASPMQTVLKSLTADGVGTTVTPGSLTLQKDESTANNLEVQGMLTLGTAASATTLTATGELSTQGITLGNIGSSASAAKLNDTALNLTVADSELLKLTGGSTTVLTLGTGYNGATTLNGEQEVLGSNGKMIYSLAWQNSLSRAAAGSMLVLTANTNPTYVQDKVGETVSSYTHNGRAGLSILNDAYAAQNPQFTTPGSALAELIDAVDAGKMTDECLSAVAGASTAVLGQALSGDVERQLRAIRNRSLAGNDAATVTLVDEKSGLVSSEASTRFFAWVNAEGNRAEQNADGCAAGYTLSSWGGTVGAGMQVNNQLTLGLALTAMYGDLQSDGPDYLKGDMDTTYVSAFARYNRGAWSHAFIGTVGTMEADYKRTVSHAAGGYNTSGDTEGTAFGLMYELSRDYALSNNSSISPVFNISYRHTEVDSYSERGTDAALNVGEQSLNTVTVGLGARYAAVLGQQTLNRACAFEARALAKYDFGDRQSTTSTGFINRATRAGIESAELGAFGVELGAGISVPVGSGSIFADGAVELRSDYTNFNATVGCKIQF